MGTIEDKLNRLLDTKQAIKAAIVGQGVEVAEEDPFSAYPDKVAAIQTGAELPELTDPATYEDVLLGKEFIDQNGEKQYGALQLYAYTPGWEARIPVEKAYDSGDVLLRMTDGSAFGDAAAGDVAEGKTFTSANGVRLVGTHKCSGGSETTYQITVYNQANGDLSVFCGGKFTAIIPGGSAVVETSGPFYIIDSSSANYCYGEGASATVEQGSENNLMYYIVTPSGDNLYGAVYVDV